MSSNSERIESLDVARGATILLVVAWHSFLAAKTVGPVDPAISTISYLLANVRMPMFFFCSGLLAHWGLNRSWSDLLKGRVWTMVWIYVVWSTLTLVLVQIYPVMPWHDEAQRLDGFLWLSFGNQWFVYALICATLFARAIYRLPLALQVVLTLLAQVALHAWSPELRDYTTNFDQLVAMMASFGLVSFMVGIWLARTILPTLSEPRRAALVLLGGAVASAGLLAAEKSLQLELPHLLKAAPGVLAGLALASLLSRVPLVRAPMQWVGRRTLEIFLFHQFVIGALTVILLGVGTDGTLAFVVMTPVTCALALAFAWAATSGSVGRILFRPPKPVMWRPRPASV